MLASPQTKCQNGDLTVGAHERSGNPCSEKNVAHLSGNIQAAAWRVPDSACVVYWLFSRENANNVCPSLPTNALRPLRHT
jgi:hypothetical protein